MNQVEEMPAENDVRMVELPADKLDRLLALNERLARAVERLLNRQADQAARYAKKAGPTTAQAEARVAERLRKMGL
jgi:CRP-like cAMP-binding protein